MRAAIVKNDHVVNIIEYDPDTNYDPGDGLALVPLSSETTTPSFGSLWTGEVFVPQEQPPVPSESDPDQVFVTEVEAATTLEELKAVLIGNRGPGAAARRGKPE